MANNLSPESHLHLMILVKRHIICVIAMLCHSEEHIATVRRNSSAKRTKDKNKNASDSKSETTAESQARLVAPAARPPSLARAVNRGPHCTVIVSCADDVCWNY